MKISKHRYIMQGATRLPYCLMDEYLTNWDCGQIEDMRVLLRAGADVNARNRSYMTPLHYATRAGRAGPVNVLLQFGADMQARDVNQISAMHHAAASRKSPDAISVLMEKGLNIEARDNWQKNTTAPRIAG